MPDRHKSPTITLRLPERDRTWLLAHAADSGRTVNAIVTEALAVYRKRIQARERRERTP